MIARVWFLCESPTKNARNWMPQDGSTFLRMRIVCQKNSNQGRKLNLSLNNKIDATLSLLFYEAKILGKFAFLLREYSKCLHCSFLSLVFFRINWQNRSIDSGCQWPVDTPTFPFRGGPFDVFMQSEKNHCCKICEFAELFLPILPSRESTIWTKWHSVGGHLELCTPASKAYSKHFRDIRTQKCTWNLVNVRSTCSIFRRFMEFIDSMV